MKVDQIEGQWWIMGVPDSIETVGPYETKAAATQDMRGLKRFFKEELRQDEHDLQDDPVHRGDPV